MRYVSIIVFVLSFSAQASALTGIPLNSEHAALRAECDRIEESYPDFACLRFELYQSSSENLVRDLKELKELNDWRLQQASWALLIETLMSSMNHQIHRYEDPADRMMMEKTKAKNHWQLLQLKQGLEHFWVDPNTYWFPSVNAISFVAVNITQSQILVISHGERN
ncbi:hypothetical protein [Bdellovibrio sp.]|uniref:hypothetical protein n=1 Tax=Bdellovibrio TaxID=958 RepID=UPI0032219DC4